MEQGTAGFMTGFAFPEILTAMNDAAQVPRSTCVEVTAGCNGRWDGDERRCARLTRATVCRDFTH